MERKTHEDTDRDLVARVLRNEEDAFARLVERYHRRVFRLVYGILGDWQHSEDVSQDVFVSIYLKLRDFGFRAQLSTWIYRVAVNAALKARGRVHRRREELSASADGGGFTEDSVARRVEDEDLVAKLLRPLPRHLRTVVLLKEREGLTYKEIASVLGCTAGAVEQRLYRAFARLREIWKDRLHELGLED